MERQVVMGCMTGEHFCQHATDEAGGCPETKAGVRWRLLCQHKNRPLALSSLFACRQAACEALREGRLIEWSGRRGSNPRQPAWKAGCSKFAECLLSIGLLSRFTRYSLNVHTSDKSCRVHAAKAVASFLPFWEVYLTKDVASFTRQHVTRFVLAYSIYHSSSGSKVSRKSGQGV